MTPIAFHNGGDCAQGGAFGSIGNGSYASGLEDIEVKSTAKGKRNNNHGSIVS